MSNLFDRFLRLATSSLPEDRSLAPVLLSRNTDGVQAQISAFFPEYVRLLDDVSPVVRQTAFLHVYALLGAALVGDAMKRYKEIYDPVYAVFCARFPEISEATVRDVLLYMRPSERSERIFRFVVPEILGEDVGRKMAILDKVPVMTEFLVSTEIRDFVGPLLESSAADEQAVVRRAAARCIASLVRDLKPQTLEIFVNLIEDNNWSVRLEVVRGLHVLGGFMKSDLLIHKAMTKALADPSLVVAREASVNVVRWISGFFAETEVPTELVTEFKDVFRVFMQSPTCQEESALCLAEKFGEAVVILGESHFEEDTFIDAVALFNRSFDVHSQTALARAIPKLHSVTGDAHVYALLDMYIKAHRHPDTFMEAVKSLIAVIPNLDDNLSLRLLVTLSLQPKRHLAAWRRRLVLADHLISLAEVCFAKFALTDNWTDILRHILTPLWLRLLADPAAAVRTQTAQTSGELARIILTTDDHRQKFIQHILDVFSVSQSANYRRLFILVAISLLDADISNSALLNRLDQIQLDPVESVRALWIESRAGERAQPVHAGLSGDTDTMAGPLRERRVSDVAWIFGEAEEAALVSPDGSDLSSDRPSSPPADYVEVGEANDAWNNFD